MQKENWFYLLIGAIISFLISIYWIGVYDNNYPGFRFLQISMGVVAIVLFVVALIIRTVNWEPSDEKPGKKSSEKRYVASKNEKVYHKVGCSLAKKILAKNKEYSESTSKFRERNYEPCDVCMLK